MHLRDDLLQLAKRTTAAAGARLASFADGERRYGHSAANAKEVKAIADTILEEDILRALAPAGLPILSEESGLIAGHGSSRYRFIVDPLDGTFNFVKGLGPSAVCVGLWEGEVPVFGVIYSLADRRLFWGGVQLGGAFADCERISVSTTTRLEHASLCTGFPARFEFSGNNAAGRFLASVGRYAKVRMLGSAAVSLLHVARGSADAYAEDNIMLWDVAAGVAIVEGAGGRVTLDRTDGDWCYRVLASNRRLAVEMPV
jgi:myo-inositol-1(or 4)-monophosphatase